MVNVNSSTVAMGTCPTTYSKLCALLVVEVVCTLLSRHAVLMDNRLSGEVGLRVGLYEFGLLQPRIVLFS